MLFDFPGQYQAVSTPYRPLLAQPRSGRVDLAHLCLGYYYWIARALRRLPLDDVEHDVSQRHTDSVLTIERKGQGTDVRETGATNWR